MHDFQTSINILRSIGDDEPVYAINNSAAAMSDGRGGDINFVVRDAAGVLAMRVPLAGVPCDLTLASKDGSPTVAALKASSELRRQITNGNLIIITKERAEAMLATPEGQKEHARVTSTAPRNPDEAYKYMSPAVKASLAKELMHEAPATTSMLATILDNVESGVLRVEDAATAITSIGPTIGLRDIKIALERTRLHHTLREVLQRLNNPGSRTKTPAAVPASKAAAAAAGPARKGAVRKTGLRS